jgi:6-phosphofructokinase 1
MPSGWCITSGSIGSGSASSFVPRSSGAFDRLLATRLGAAAVQALARGEHGVLAGLVRGEVGTTPLAEVVTHRKEIDLELLELARVMSQ